MKYILFAFLLINTAFSQNNVSQTIYNTIDVDVKPVFAKGEKELYKFIKQNFNQKIANQIKGEILVSFVVEIDGSLSEIGVLSDLGKGSANEAIRVMELSPKWIPGKKTGVAVRTQYLVTIPINTFTAKKKKK